MIQLHKLHLAGAGVTAVSIVTIVATADNLVGKTATCLEQSWPPSWPGASVLLMIAAFCSALAPFLTALAPALGGGDGKGPKVPPVVMSALMLFALAVLLSGCLSNTPIVPVTPANQQAISDCRTDSNVHNSAAIGGAIATAAGTGLGVAAGVDPDPKAKNALAYSAAGTAALVAIAGGLVLEENQLYQAGGCSQLMGPLPTLGKDGKPVAKGFIPGDFADHASIRVPTERVEVEQ